MARRLGQVGLGIFLLVVGMTDLIFDWTDRHDPMTAYYLTVLAAAPLWLAYKGK